MQVDNENIVLQGLIIDISDNKKIFLNIDENIPVIYDNYVLVDNDILVDKEDLEFIPEN